MGEANQRRRRVQRDKRVVWERPGVCAPLRVPASERGVGGLNKAGARQFLGGDPAQDGQHDVS